MDDDPVIGNDDPVIGNAPVTKDEGDRREALAAAGYTSFRGAVFFCLMLAAIGALFGSVVFAILLSLAMPENSAAENTVFGVAAGVALGLWIGLVKIRQGNLEARELVEDGEWRRLALRQHIDRPR